MVVERFASLFAEELRLVYKWNYLLIEFPGITRMNYKSKLDYYFFKTIFCNSAVKNFYSLFLVVLEIDNPEGHRIIIIVLSPSL